MPRKRGYPEKHPEIGEVWGSTDGRDISLTRHCQIVTTVRVDRMRATNNRGWKFIR